MILPEAEKAGRDLRNSCMNIIGFWQLLQVPGTPRNSAVNRMQQRAYLTSGAIKMADLILQHHEIIGQAFIGKPDRMEEFKATATKIKFLAAALDGDNPEQFADEAVNFAWQFLGAMNEWTGND